MINFALILAVVIVVGTLINAWLNPNICPRCGLHKVDCMCGMFD